MSKPGMLPRWRGAGGGGFVPENKAQPGNKPAEAEAVKDGVPVTWVTARDKATAYAAEEWPEEQAHHTADELRAIADEIAFNAAERGA